jgi:arsenate reductase
MRVTIYHNPKCGTSRTVLSMIRAKGIEPEVIEYLATPPDTGRLKELLHRMHARPRALLRRRGTPYDDLGLDDASLTDEALVGMIAKHPILMERPVVVSDRGAKICRPAEVVNTLI